MTIFPVVDLPLVGVAVIWLSGSVSFTVGWLSGVDLLLLVIVAIMVLSVSYLVV